jgi:prepilin-type N-terminal cleavage/methylation domain-containing protein
LLLSSFQTMRTALGSTPASLRQQGFTLVEVVTAIALLVLFSGGALWTLTQTNNYAALSRLYTGAQVLAQNQIDLIMSKGPFNPQPAKGEVPTVLGGPTPLAAGETKTVIELPNSDPDPKKRNLIVYSEPLDPNSSKKDEEKELLIIQAEERATTIRDARMVVDGRTVYMYSATVVVRFKYRGKDHEVQLNAMRASDTDGA